MIGVRVPKKIGDNALMLALIEGDTMSVYQGFHTTVTISRMIQAIYQNNRHARHVLHYYAYRVQFAANEEHRAVYDQMAEVAFKHKPRREEWRKFGIYQEFLKLPHTDNQTDRSHRAVEKWITGGSYMDDIDGLLEVVEAGRMDLRGGYKMLYEMQCNELIKLFPA